MEGSGIVGVCRIISLPSSLSCLLLSRDIIVDEGPRCLGGIFLGVESKSFPCGLISLSWASFGDDLPVEAGDEARVFPVDPAGGEKLSSRIRLEAIGEGV
jgi:hypothetical protein